MKFSMEGATPSFEDSDGQLVAAGIHIRLRIKGIRSELNQMFAIGSIREDFLGYDSAALTEQITSITDTRSLVLLSRFRFPDIAHHHNPFLSLCCSTRAIRQFLLKSLLQAVYYKSGLQRGVGDMGCERKRRERKITHKARTSHVYVFHVIIKQDTQSEQKIVRSVFSVRRYRLTSFGSLINPFYPFILSFTHHASIQPTINQSIIIPLQPRPTSLPMPPKRTPLIKVHNPPKQIPFLIQPLQKSPEPSQNKVSITHLLPQHKRPTSMLPQNPQ